LVLLEPWWLEIRIQSNRDLGRDSLAPEFAGRKELSGVENERPGEPPVSEHFP